MNALGKGSTPQPSRLNQPPNRPRPNSAKPTVTRASRSRYPGRDQDPDPEEAARVDAQIENTKHEIRALAIRYRRERDSGIQERNPSQFATRAAIRHTRIRNRMFAAMKDGSPKEVENLWMRFLVTEVIFDEGYGPKDE